MARAVFASLLAACGGSAAAKEPAPPPPPVVAVAPVKAPPPLSVAPAAAADPCAAGDMDACVARGEELRGGVHESRPVNNDEALAIFARACEKDHARGCEAFAEMHQSAPFYGLANEDPEACVRAWDKACRLGNAHACYRLGFYYWEGLTKGLVVERDGKVRPFQWPADRGLGLPLMRRGCEAHVDEACKHLDAALREGG